MALNSSQIKVQQAFENIMTKAAAMRSNLLVQRAALVVDGVSADTIFNTMRGVKATRDIMSAAVAVPGLQAYARSMYDDPAKDFVADVNAAISECNSLLTWVATNFPKDANGYLLKDRIVNGEIVPRTFTAASIASLIPEIDQLIAEL